MFLKLRKTTFATEDRGAALGAVMGLMLIGALLSVLILSSVVASIASTTTSRATVQSEAAAQAGVDVALASVMSGSCASTYTTSVAPKYSVQVSYTTATTISSSTTWTNGCPTASARWMRLLSTGTAASVAVGSTTTGNTERVEAIYSRPVAAATLTASGPAVYAYSWQSVGGSGSIISKDGSNNANVLLRTGDVTCSGGAGIKGDIVVQQGNLTLSGSCGVTGGAWASGSGKGVVALSGGVSVGGSVVANSLTIASGNVGGSTWTSGATSISSATIGGGVTVTANNFVTGGSNKIGGSLWASGSAEVTNGDDVKVNATAQSLKLSGGNIGTSASNEAWARGAVTGVDWYTIKAHITAQSIQAGVRGGGTNTVVPAGPGAGPAAPTAPTAPTVPNWINFTYSAADWSGFTVKTLASSACNASGINAAITSLSGAKGIIDARACANPIYPSDWEKMPLSNDLVILSTKGFNFGGSSGFTASAPVRLWLITPDTTVESPTAPTCPSGSSVTLGGAFSFDSKISSIIYTPCLASIGSGIEFYGQVFAGQASIHGNAKLTYTAVGLPGYNLNTGATSTSSGSTSAWTVTSVRNVVG